MLYEFPNNLRQGEKKTAPIYFLKQYDHFVYWNLDDPVDDTGFADWRLRLYRKDGSLAYEFPSGTLIKHTISGSLCRFYCTMNLPASIPSMIPLVLMVVDSSDGSIKYSDNRPLITVPQSEIEQFLFVEFRNSTDFDNYPYEEAFFSGKYNSLLLDMNHRGSNFEYVFDEYTEYSEGNKVVQYVERHKQADFESYYFDEDMNDLMGSLSCHDDVKLTGKT